MTLYEYESQTFTEFVDYLIPDMPRSRMDSSILLAYYNVIGSREDLWYPVPGIGQTYLYIVGSFWYVSSTPNAYELRLFTANFDGTIHSGSKTFTKFRIFVVNASEVLPQGKSGKGDLLDKLKEDGVDVNDYFAVMDYFGLEY